MFYDICAIDFYIDKKTLFPLYRGIGFYYKTIFYYFITDAPMPSGSKLMVNLLFQRNKRGQGFVMTKTMACVTQDFLCIARLTISSRKANNTRINNCSHQLLFNWLIVIHQSKFPFLVGVRYLVLDLICRKSWK